MSWRNNPIPIPPLARQAMRPALASGKIVRLPSPVKDPTHAFYLVWSKSARCHPRVAFARTPLIDSVDARPQQPGSAGPGKMG